jgi:hypothetical protein
MARERYNLQTHPVGHSTMLQSFPVLRFKYLRVIGCQWSGIEQNHLRQPISFGTSCCHDLGTKISRIVLRLNVSS